MAHYAFELIIYAKCTSPGYLVLNTYEPFTQTDQQGRETVDWFGNTGMAFYKFQSAEGMHSTACSYDWIIRGGRKMKGSNYTLEMARSDWQNWTN